MAKKSNTEPLVFVNNETGETVTIEFNRRVILRMEREGFGGEALADSMKTAPISSVVELFYYGMLMHQPETTLDEATDFFFDNVGADTGIIERLTDLYAKPYEDMLTAQRKNSRWTMK